MWRARKPSIALVGLFGCWDPFAVGDRDCGLWQLCLAVVSYGRCGNHWVPSVLGDGVRERLRGCSIEVRDEMVQIMREAKKLE